MQAPLANSLQESSSNAKLEPCIKGREYSTPPKIAASPPKKASIENSPPSPEAKSLVRNLSFSFEKGFVILWPPPRDPKPIPSVRSKFLNRFEATINSLENNPVPARSLKPTASSGKYSVSLSNLNFASKLLSLKDCPPLNSLY